MIEQDDIDIEEKHMARVCLDTLEALVFLHEHHRIHRDIKSDNMLMDSSGSVKVNIYIINFQKKIVKIGIFIKIFIKSRN